jgi:3-oxoacyl-[acyl-carrier protein] reductase
MGKATALLFAQEGANVAVTDQDGAGAERVASEATAQGGTAWPWMLDVADEAQIRSVISSIAAHFGGIDMVANNAAIAGLEAIDSPSYDKLWDRTQGILLTAQQKIIRAALPYLRRSQSPRIVNIASTEALGATALDSAYCAAKAGVVGLTRALAVELGAERITVNCVCPGPISTGMTGHIFDEHKTIYAKRRTALKCYGEPEEVAHMTLNLFLPASSYVTGAIIPVDGGLTARNA